MQAMLDFYELEIDTDTIPTKSGDSLTRADLEAFLMDDPKKDPLA